MNSFQRFYSQAKPVYFYASLVCICLAYTLTEYFYIPRLAFAADELVFAKHIFEYTHHLPYLSFEPYKTVLGYYVLSLPFYFSHDIILPLIYIKFEMTLINVCCIALSCYWAKQFFSRQAIILTLLLLLANQFFFLYSVELRVDLLTVWVALLSTLCVLNNKIKRGGFLTGIAFLISQKALWYIAAINGAIMICAFLKFDRGYSFKSLIQFNVMCILPIVCYLLFWSCLATPQAVLHNLFYEAYIQARIEFYNPIYFTCWRLILYHGAVVFLFLPMLMIYLFLAPAISTQRVFILSFSLIALELFLKYKQPFPYNFVFTIPSLFLLYNEFFSVFLENVNKDLTQTDKTQFLILTFAACYTYFLFCFINLLALPILNNLLLPIPLMICYLLTKAHRKLLYSRIILILLIVSSILYPLYQSFNRLKFDDGLYQQHMMRVADRLLNPNDGYVGGIPFLYNRDQAITGLKNLIGPALLYLNDPQESIRPLLLSSLYLSPVSQQEILKQLEIKPVKLFMSNFRLMQLPNTIRDYLYANFQHYYGSIYLYAPTINPEQKTFMIKFDGTYRIQTVNNIQITIDQHHMQAGDTIILTKGQHYSTALEAYRLVFITDQGKALMQKTYQDNNFTNMFRLVLT